MAVCHATHEIHTSPGVQISKSGLNKLMGVSKNRGGPPKWMVYNGKSLLRWMIWGEIPPLFLETPKNG